MVREISSATNINFCLFRLFFRPFTTLTTTKNQNFEKMIKAPADVIILHQCTKNHDYMLHCSRDMVCGQCNCYFSFWAIFCPFTAQKMKFQKKKKKKRKEKIFLEISSYYTCVP